MLACQDQVRNPFRRPGQPAEARTRPGGKEELIATIVEVAGLAGVSTSTVSHVLNGTRRVEPDTRRRVLDAVEKTAYRQDALARALRRSRTDSVGLVVSDAGEPAFADMVHGVEHAAARAGLTLLLANSAEGEARELGAVRTLLERRVDGLILARAANSSDEVMTSLAQEKTPVVLLDRIFPELPFDQVAAENHEPMGELVRHLVAAGHRRFCVVAGDVRVPSLYERLAGFTAAITAAGLDAAAQIVLGAPATPAAIRDAVSAPNTPSVVVACSTPLAAAALSGLRLAGLSAPADIAFATFDGFSHSDLFEPSLTTVRQPAFDVGVAAIELLRERLAGGTAVVRTIRLQQRIEYRASTAGYVVRPGHPRT